LGRNLEYFNAQNLDLRLIFGHNMPVVYDSRKEIVARSFRMSGVVCFVFLLISSNKYFGKETNTLAFWKFLPRPIVASLSISIILAIGAQIWLKNILRAKSRLED